MSDPVQSVASPPSASFASRYAAYNPSRGYQAKPWNKLFALFVSLPKTGKSTFIESCPDLLRFDLDRAGTSNPQTRCLTVPALQDSNGAPIVVTKDMIDKVIAQLVSDAKSNIQPRPKVVAFDTVDKLVEILCFARAAQLNLKSFWEAEKSEWGTIYNWVADYCNLLIQHGYGVWLCSHIVNKHIQIGEAAKMQLDLTLRDTLFTRIRGALDAIVAVESVDEIESIPIPKVHPTTGQPILLANGQQAIDRFEQKSTRHVELVFDQGKPAGTFDPDFSRLVCNRIRGLPARIRLPRVDAWETVRSTYEDAAKKDGATLLP